MQLRRPASEQRGIAHVRPDRRVRKVNAGGRGVLEERSGRRRAGQSVNRLPFAERSFEETAESIERVPPTVDGAWCEALQDAEGGRLRGAVDPVLECPCQAR